MLTSPSLAILRLLEKEDLRGLRGGQCLYAGQCGSGVPRPQAGPGMLTLLLSVTQSVWREMASDPGLTLLHLSSFIPNAK